MTMTQLTFPAHAFCWHVSGNAAWVYTQQCRYTQIFVITPTNGPERKSSCFDTDTTSLVTNLATTQDQGIGSYSIDAGTTTKVLHGKTHQVRDTAGRLQHSGYTLHSLYPCAVYASDGDHDLVSLQPV